MYSNSSRPVPGERPNGKKDRSLLLIAFFDPCGIGTIAESLAAWQLHSRHEVTVLNLWPNRGGALRLPHSLLLDDFDAVIVHPTVSYSASNVEMLDEGLKRDFPSYEGVKVLMKQDEQVTALRFSKFVRDKGFDLLFTCVPSSEHGKVYPRATIGGCELVQVLTGYVSLNMRRGLNECSRDIDVSYRGSIQPLEFGRLGYEKRGIGYDVSRALSGHDLRVDISSRWEDRIYGDEWAGFLSRSRVVLGVESGSNLFDFDGKVAEWCREYESAHPEDDPACERYYLAAHEAYLHKFEDNVFYAQISPRHFESAAAGAAQLLYEGNYSGIFKPHEHFMPLRRDLGNIDEAFDFIRDEAACSRMARATFEEVILDKRNWYETFVAQADDVIERAWEKKGLLPGGRVSTSRRSISSDRPVAFVTAAHEPTADPRIGWFASSLARTHEVYVIGTYRSGEVGDGPTHELTSEGINVVRVERTKHNGAWVPSTGQLVAGLSAARGLLGSLAGYTMLPEGILLDRLGAHGATPEDLARFRSLCGYMVNTNSALLEAMQRMGTPDIVVAADLETLPSAAILADEVGSFCVFDAHEFWPFSFHSFQYWEIEFWIGIERQLSKSTDLRLTVSPQLAKIMGDEYGCEFLTVPNCARLTDGDGVDLVSLFRKRSQPGPLKVIFLGGFSEDRGLEEAIRAFALVKSDAHLILQGPDNPCRQTLMKVAQSLGLGPDRVSFPSAVSESMLVATAADAHIGLIPYKPINLNNRFCCPNKLSQYAAGGLPIISSRTEYVSGIVEREKIGYVVDISNPREFASLIDRINADRSELTDMGPRARRFFEERYNWDVVAPPVLSRVAEMGRCSDKGRIDLDWISVASEHRQRHGDTLPISPILLGASDPLPPALEKFDGVWGTWLRRRLWRSLPKSFRYTLVAWLRKHIN